jgi:poly(hydroxyalkanoate) depolymerase family esterase
MRRGHLGFRALPRSTERRVAAREIAPIEHRLFVPSQIAGPAPLVVALHGCTQTAGDFAAGTRFDSVAERAGAFVVYPEQGVRANGNRCWNWFLETHQARERGEPAAIIALVGDLIGRHPIDPQRVFVAGLSAGGAMAAILAEQAPDVFAAAGIMAGVPLHISHNLESALAAMRGHVTLAESVTLLRRRAPQGACYDRLRVTVWTGLGDRTVDPRNELALVDQFRVLTGVSGVDGESDTRPDAAIERWRDASGRTRVESVRLPGIGHAWSGGSFRGSHTDPKGPRASDAMMAFFLEDVTRGGPQATETTETRHPKMGR